MFGLFKKRQPALPAEEPNLLHRTFARNFVPDSIKHSQGTLLNMLLDKQASQILQKIWKNLGSKLLPPELLIPPTDLSVSVFRHEKHLGYLIQFPAPKAAGEAYFGLLVAGPSNDWSQDDRAKVQARYFILERSKGEAPEMFEWKSITPQHETVYESLGSGTGHPVDFSNAILSRFYGLKSDGTFYVRSEDAEMSEAIATARRTLPDYWDVFEKRSLGEADFSLKVKISDSHGSEHFWLVDVTRENGVVYGTLDNDPTVVTTVKAGDRFSVSMEDVSDWGYFRNGKMHGKHTLRVLLKHMPPQEAEMYRRIMAE